MRLLLLPAALVTCLAGSGLAAVGDRQNQLDAFSGNYWRLPSFSLSGTGAQNTNLNLCAEPLPNSSNSWGLSLRVSSKTANTTVPPECAFSIEAAPFNHLQILVWNVAIALKGINMPLTVTTDGWIGFGPNFQDNGYENPRFALNFKEGESTTVAIAADPSFPRNGNCLARSAASIAFRAGDGGGFNLDADCTSAFAKWTLGPGWKQTTTPSSN